MPPPFKIGIVGCGGISRGLYVRHLTEVADRVQVVAVCDVVREKAEERSTQYRETYEKLAAEYEEKARAADGDERERQLAAAETCRRGAAAAPRVYTDHEQLARDPEVEVVFVTTQPVMHPVASIAAAEAGKHVWSEGPMGAYLDDDVTLHVRLGVGQAA